MSAKSWRRPALVATLILGAGGCDKDAKRELRLKRSGSSAAVVVVQAEPEEGAVTPEVEPNDELPQSFVIGVRMMGSLEGSLDVDRYQVGLQHAGMLFVTLEGASDADLKLQVESADGQVLAQSDRGPAGLAEGIAGYPVSAGSVYQLVVSEFTKKKLRKTGGRSGTSQPYTLKTRLQVGSEIGAEVEGLTDTPSGLVVGTPGYGYIGWKGDQDHWQLPLSQSLEVGSIEDAGPQTRSALNIYVSAVERVALRLEIANAKGVVLASLRSAPGQEVALRGLVPDVGTEYYRIRVQGDKRSNPMQAYVLRADEVQLGAEQESEPNNQLAQASLLVGEEGQLQNANGEVCLGDVDYYAIASSSSARLVDVTLTGSSEAQLVLSVVSENGAVVAEGEPGMRSLQAVPLAANSEFAIAVRAEGVTQPLRYKLAVSLVTSLPVPTTETRANPSEFLE